MRRRPRRRRGRRGTSKCLTVLFQSLFTSFIALSKWNSSKQNTTTQTGTCLPLQGCIKTFSFYSSFSQLFHHPLSPLVAHLELTTADRSARHMWRLQAEPLRSRTTQAARCPPVIVLVGWVTDSSGVPQNLTYFLDILIYFVQVHKGQPVRALRCKGCWRAGRRGVPVRRGFEGKEGGGFSLPSRLWPPCQSEAGGNADLTYTAELP